MNFGDILEIGGGGAGAGAGGLIGGLIGGPAAPVTAGAGSALGGIFGKVATHNAIGAAEDIAKDIGNGDIGNAAIDIVKIGLNPSGAFTDGIPIVEHIFNPMGLF